MCCARYMRIVCKENLHQAVTGRRRLAHDHFHGNRLEFLRRKILTSQLLIFLQTRTTLTSQLEIRFTRIFGRFLFKLDDCFIFVGTRW